MKLNKRLKKTVIIIALLICVPALTLWAKGFDGGSDRIPNPYHQHFDPDQFRFEDYTESKCISWEILAKLFPPGTPKSFVDRVLVKAGGAKATKVPDHVGLNMYSYYKALEPPAVFMSAVWNVAVQYDNDMKVEAISMGGGGPESVYDYYNYCLKTSYRKNWGIENE